jgi:hypothetical protein
MRALSVLGTRFGALLIEFGRRQIEADLGAVVRLLDRQTVR